MAKAKKPKAPASASKSIEGAIQTTHYEHDYGPDGSVETARTGPRPDSPSTSIAQLPIDRTEESEAPGNDEAGMNLGSREAGTPQTDKAKEENGEGEVTFDAAAVGLLDDSAGHLACETRAQASNRWILEGRRWETDRFRQDLIRQCRADGMTREAASNRAWEACLARFPPPGVEPQIAEELPPEPEPAVVEPPPKPAVEPVVEVAQTAPVAEPGVSGLGELPDSWGELPANAQLQVEIAWVSANRLRVRSGNGVDLSRALSPAPSYSALSWLETSILFPSKFADISVKATAQQDDEREGIRREKLAIEEIRSILKEMLEG